MLLIVRIKTGNKRTGVNENGIEHESFCGDIPRFENRDPPHHSFRKASVKARRHKDPFQTKAPSS